MVPSRLTPRLSSTECTPIAGISMETGTERSSDSHHAQPGPVVPAADWEGCGACCWAAIAAPTAAAPPAMSTAPATPATRARKLPGLAGLRAGGVGGLSDGGAGGRRGGGVGGLPGGGADSRSGQDMTTRNPAMRRQSACFKAVSLAFLREFYPRSLEITVMKKPLSACSVRWANFYGRRRFLRTVLSCAALAILATASVSACTGGSPSA